LISLRKYNEPSFEDTLAFDPHDVFLAGLRNHHVSNTAYPISHNVTWKDYRVAKEDYSSYLHSALRNIEAISLYVQVPFCEKRCYYCEYTVVSGKESDYSTLYIDYLLKEIEMYGRIADWEDKRISGFDIGGGTPSILENDLVGKILHKIRNTFPGSKKAKISIETTPKIAAENPDKLLFYKNSGIDRISMGIQVADPDLLKKFNRGDNGESLFSMATENIRKTGFEKFNVDLMYGFSEQSLKSWEHTLQKAVSLNPDYITLYRMRYKLTKISSQAGRVRLMDVMRHSRLAREVLEANGYFAPYGKNTYTRDRAEEGTSEYLTNRVIHGTPYLGFGLGAQSFLNSSVAYNCGAASKSISPYRSALECEIFPIQDLYDLPVCQVAAKMISVSFYFGGINRESFTNKFGFSIETLFQDEVFYLKSKALMHEQDGWLRLTRKGEKFINGVIALFYAGSIKSLLLKSSGVGKATSY